MAVMMSMTGHYPSDTHMPFRCDNRKLACTSSGKNPHRKSKLAGLPESDVLPPRKNGEDLWQKTVNVGRAIPHDATLAVTILWRKVWADFVLEREN